MKTRAIRSFQLYRSSVKTGKACSGICDKLQHKKIGAKHDGSVLHAAGVTKEAVAERGIIKKRKNKN